MLLTSATYILLSKYWYSRCALTVINATESPDLVYSGQQSLHLAGSKQCFLFRPIGPSCTARRVLEPIQAGDTLLISLKVRIDTAGQVFQVYTGHYHADKGRRRWALPGDDSQMVSRTLVPNANEW